jgi:hypothetical protein
MRREGTKDEASQKTCPCILTTSLLSGIKAQVRKAPALLFFHPDYFPFAARKIV